MMIGIELTLIHSRSFPESDKSTDSDSEVECMSYSSCVSGLAAIMSRPICLVGVHVMTSSTEGGAISHFCSRR